MGVKKNEAYCNSQIGCKVLCGRNVQNFLEKLPLLRILLSLQARMAELADLPARLRSGWPAEICPSGGIGRHARFRAVWPRGRRSSSLLSGTDLEVYPAVQAGALASGASDRKVVQVQVLPAPSEFASQNEGGVPGTEVASRSCRRLFC